VVVMMMMMGPSGSGKPAPLNLAAGLDKPTSGTVTVTGHRVDALSETRLARYRRTRVGMIFQFFKLLEDLTVAGAVLLAQRGIERYKGSCPGRVPGGERQRLAIARALVSGPAVLLADEPAETVNTATGEEIGRLLRELNAAGQTLVLVTQSLAVRCAKWTVRLAGGRTATGLAGDPAGVAGRPGAGTRP
jgi:putative ABC transport system ATP-binding protein